MRALRVLPWVACLGLLLPELVHSQGVTPMPRTAFDALFAQVNNAGRWGAEDERGTLNLITPEVRRGAGGAGRDHDLSGARVGAW